MMKTTKIITHNGGFHADECLAIAIILEFWGVSDCPISRQNEVSEEDLSNRTVAVIDIGGSYNPKLLNFDHHQDGSLEASCALVLNYTFNKSDNDRKIRNAMFKHLFSSVSAIDRGIAPVQPGTINGIIKSMNVLNEGFTEALTICRTIVRSYYKNAVEMDNSAKYWASLGKYGKVAISHRKISIMNWKSMAKDEGILALIAPGRTKGSYCVISRDVNDLVIGESPLQTFRHTSGFMAEYSNAMDAVEHCHTMNLL